MSIKNIDLKWRRNALGNWVRMLEWYECGVDGKKKRFRRDFADEEEATEEHQKLVIQANNQDGPQLRLSSLTHEQERDALVAFDLLERGGTGQNLRFAVEFFNRNYRPASTTKTLEAALAEFLAEKESAGLRPDSMRDLRNRLNNPRQGLLAEHAGKMVSDITASDITKLISKPEWTATGRFNERKTLNNFFAWSAARGYCAANPVAAVTIPKRKKSAVGVLGLEDTRKLLIAALAFEGGALVPNIVLRLFCGLRPEEVSRIKWSNIDLGGGIIHITEEISKTREPREVKLEANTADWLRPHFAKTPIEPKGFDKKWTKLRQDAGFDVSSWIHDVLRHTAASNHASRHGEAKTSNWSGHRVEVLNRHYRKFISEANSDVFWSLTPETVKTQPVPMPESKAA